MSGDGGADGALWRWEAGAIARAVRAGEVSAAEVVDRHLERIAAVNPEVNAVTRVLADTARAQAAEVDSRRAAGVDPGPLAGVPFTVKENIAVGGVSTTHGARWFRDATATADAPPVARLRAAGAIPVGRGNMPTLTLAGMHSRSEFFGDTVNPWDSRVTPGGSSGGDGAAVAAGLTPLGPGNDSGGSVRVPAAFCGVTGLKPTEGRFPADHRIGTQDPPLSAQTIPVDGPPARTVGDLRLAFEALAGPGADPRDPRAVPAPTRGSDVGLARVAVVADPGGRGVYPWVREAVDTAAAYLSDAGYDVTEVPDVPRHDEALEAYGRMIMTEFATTWPSVKRILGEGGHHYTEMSMARTAPVDLPEYLRLIGVRLTVRRAWAELLAEYPLLLGPVFTSPPPAPGLESRDEEGHRAVTEALRLCTVTGFAGVPAVAVPAGVWGDLPQGVQIVGRVFREGLCLAAAEAVERRVGRLTPSTPDRDEPCDQRPIWPYDGAVLVKWMRCTVVDRRGFERGQRKWAGLLGEPGFRAQGGGWSRARPGVAHLFGFWESRAFYDSFMARSHDRLAAAQNGTYKDAQVRLFEYRFDVKVGFQPGFADADLLRVAHCKVRRERIEHYILMQEKVWNPAMAGSPGMLRGVFAQARSEDEFLVLSMWDSAAEHGKYRTERIERLALRAQLGADVTAVTGDVIDLEPAWTV